MLALEPGVTTIILSVIDQSGEFIDTVKVLDDVTADSVNTTVYMVRKPEAVTIDPSEENTLSLSDDPNTNGSLGLVIPANSFFTESGELVEGPVNVFLSVIPPALSIVDNAPGAFMVRHLHTTILLFVPILHNSITDADDGRSGDDDDGTHTDHIIILMMMMMILMMTTTTRC